jgi:hypothetical protein
MSLHGLETGDLHAACVQIAYTIEWSQHMQCAAGISLRTNVSVNLNVLHEHQTVFQGLETTLS